MFSGSAALCWLHQAHFDGTSKQPRPWMVPESAQSNGNRDSETCRKTLLMDVASRAASGQPLSKAQDGHGITEGLAWETRMRAGHAPLTLCRKRLSILSSGRSWKVEIPLIYSDIVHVAVLGFEKRVGGRFAASYIIALGPRRSSQQTDENFDTEENSHEKDLQPNQEQALKKVWLLCIGNCDHYEMMKILFELGSYGAVRWDVDSLYSVTDNILWHGDFAKIAEANLKTVVSNKRDGDLNKLSVPKVAVKALHKPCKQSESLSEIEVLALVHGHPNISTLFGVFCELKSSDQVSGMQVQWYTIMNLCDGGDLLDMLNDSGGSLGLPLATTLMLGIMSALNHMHGLRIAHRDVKVENIFISKGQSILADLGVAASVDDAVAMQQMVGSPGFVAPEIMLGRSYNEKVDIFSTAVTFYAMLTGRRAIKGRNVQEVMANTVSGQVSFSAQVFQSMDEKLFSLLYGMFAKSPEKRLAAKTVLSGLWWLRCQEEEDEGPAGNMISWASVVGDINASREALRAHRDAERNVQQDPQEVFGDGEARPKPADDSKQRLRPPSHDAVPLEQSCSAPAGLAGGLNPGDPAQVPKPDPKSSSSAKKMASYYMLRQAGRQFVRRFTWKSGARGSSSTQQDVQNSNPDRFDGVASDPGVQPTEPGKDGRPRPPQNPRPRHAKPKLSFQYTPNGS